MIEVNSHEKLSFGAMFGSNDSNLSFCKGSLNRTHFGNYGNFRGPTLALNAT